MLLRPVCSLMGKNKTSAVVAVALVAVFWGLARGSTDDESPPSSNDENGDEGEEELQSLAILLQVGLLLLSMFIGKLTERYEINYIPEASVALSIGILVGMILHLVHGDHDLVSFVNFKPNFFLLFLLPPIIFESGYSMRTKPFFDNFGAICMFAFGGTIISSFVIGILMYVLGKLEICFSLPFLESMIFGSLISATDPVTVLAIFQKVGVDENLYYLLFGESCLNDAVAIVMYRSLLTFKDQPFNFKSLMVAVGTFILIFVGSFLIGTVVALLSAIVYKLVNFRGEGDSDLRSWDLNTFESSIVVLSPYISYLIAEGLNLSGIVAILFCGIVMARYTKSNLSEAAKFSTEAVYKILATLAETFVFVYMGIALFLVGEEFEWSFLMLSLIVVLTSRVVNVYPMAAAVNFFRRRRSMNLITPAQQLMMLYGGLRGGIAFTLALEAKDGDIQNQEYAKVIFTATGMNVLVLVIFIGGGTTTVIDKLGLRAQPSEDEYNAENEDRNDKESGAPMPPRDLFSLLPTKIKMRLRFREFVRRTSFRHIDSKMHKLLKKNVKKSPNGGPSRDRVISDGDDLKFTPLSMNDDDEFDGSIARNGVIEMSSPTSSEIEMAQLPVDQKSNGVEDSTNDVEANTSSGEKQ